MAHQDRLNIAVFIDFDNIEIGVKTTLNEHFDVGTILDAIKERGEVVTKIAYADWTRAGEYSRNLTQHAIRLVQRNLTPGGDKNGADINLALDALEMAFTHPHINAYVIVGGDSDFLSLVEKLKQYDKKVFVVGGRAFTSIILQRNCHEFIAYENLTGSRRTTPARGGRPVPVAASAPVAQAFQIVRRALKILSDREVTPQTGLLKSTLLQLDSTFSERNYGASSFLDFVEKLAKSGLVQVKHSGRSVLVELNENFDETARESAPAESMSAEAVAQQGPMPVEPRQMEWPGDEAQAEMRQVGETRQPVEAQPQGEPRPAGEPRSQGDGRPQTDSRPEVKATEPAANGVRQVASILASATHVRWPMYLRNVKQILRAADGGFDERRFGFGGLMDLLRACQREGLVRLERDRRGGLRVFAGPALARPTTLVQQQPPRPEPLDVAAEETAPGEAFGPSEPESEIVEPEPIDEPQPAVAIDTTAELLGTARRKRPRPGTASRRASLSAAPEAPATPARGTRKGTRKAAAGSTRRSRAKKADGQG